MTTFSAPPEAPELDESVDAGLGVRSVAELVSAALCGLHKVNDHFIRMNAALGEDGYIDVEFTRVSFGGQDAAVRVLLYPTAPVPVTSRAVHQSALQPRGAA